MTGRLGRWYWLMIICSIAWLDGGLGGGHLCAGFAAWDSGGVVVGEVVVSRA